MQKVLAKCKRENLIEEIINHLLCRSPDNAEENHASSTYEFGKSQEDVESIFHRAFFLFFLSTLPSRLVDERMMENNKFVDD